MKSVIHLIRKNFLSAAGQAAVTPSWISCRVFVKQFHSTSEVHSRGYTMALGEAVPITINGQLYRKITEGKADIVAPYQAQSEQPRKESTQSNQPRNNAEGDQAVFYNPIQQYNRDLSVLAILTYGESAVKEKASRFAKNFDKSIKRQARKKQKVTTETNGSAETDAATTSAKRKFDDTENDADNETAAKRTRSIEDEPSDDLEVRQLEQPVGNGNVTDNGQNGTAEDAKSTRRIPFTILDALSASGLRAVRYAKEIPFVTKVIANDMLPAAVEAIKLNIEHNNLSEKVIPHTGDAIKYMYNRTGDNSSGQPGNVQKFDVVDLDPYGTAAPFLDSAVQSLTDGGLLCVTCTDAAVWASNSYPEKAYALYNGTTLKGPHSHEGGLRLILNAVASSAAKYGLAIEPMLSLSIDFYARLFIRVHKSQQEVKFLAGTTMFVYACDQGCGSWQTQLIARNQKRQSKKGEAYFTHTYAQAPQGDKYCDHCGMKTHLGGPMWAGPLHHPVFVKGILDKLPDLDKTVYGTTDRIKGMLTVALEEELLDWSPSKSSDIDSTDSAVDGSVAVSTTRPSAIIPRMPPHLLSTAPFFFLPTFAAKVLSMMTPAEDPFRGALIALGYSCTRSHCKAGSFKTDAPWSVIWEVLREWIRQKEPERIPRLFGEGKFEDKASVKKSSPGYQILKKLRGRKENTISVLKMKENLLQRLGKGPSAANIDTMADLQTVLKSALYEIEHPSELVQGNVQDQKELETQRSGEQDMQTNGNEAAKITGKALIDNGGDPSELEIVFDASLGKAFKEGGRGSEKLVRYQINPRAHWGPMVRAGAK